MRVLGPLAVGGAEPVSLGGVKPKRLLAALLLEPGRPLGDDSLAELVWPDGPPDRWDTSLRAYVSRLRRRFDDHGLGIAIERDRSGYLAVLNGARLDAERFERGFHDAERLLTSGRPADGATVLADVLGQWRGRPFEDLDGHLDALPVIERLEALRLQAVELLFEARLGAGERDGLVAELTDFVERHPFRERAVGQLMRTLYGLGRQAEALALFDRTRVRLVEELGVEPGPALVEVHHAVLAHDQVLGAAGGPVVVAKPVSGGVPFTGRLDELARIDAELRPGGCLLVAGPGGIGKSRLVEQAFSGRDDVVVLRCDEPALAEPWSPWAGALRGLGRPVEASDGQLATLHLVVDELVDALAASVVVVEDLHWADRSSLGVFRLLARRLTGSSTTLVATFRRDELRGDADVHVASLASEPATVSIDLAAFDRTRSLQLVTALRGGAPPSLVELDRMLALSGGSPFHLVQLDRLVSSGHTLDELASRPDLVDAEQAHAISTLAERLGPQERRVVDLLALLGGRCAPGLLAAAAGCSRPEVESAVAAARAEGLIARSTVEGEVVVTHDLVRSTLLASMVDRHEVAWSAARLLRTDGAAPAAIVSVLLAEAGELAAGLPWAFDVHTAAAERAVNESSWAAAELAARRTESLDPSVDVERAARAALRHGEIACLAGQVAVGRRRLLEGAALASRSGDVDLQRRAVLAALDVPAGSLDLGPELASAIEQLHDLDALDERDRIEIRSRLALLDHGGELTRSTMGLGPGAPALSVGAIIGDARASGDPHLLSRALLCELLVRLRDDDQLRRLHEAEEYLAVVESDQPEGRVTGIAHAYEATWALGRHAEAAAHLADLRHRADALGHAATRWYVETYAIADDIAAGRYAAAEERALGALALGQDVMGSQATAAFGGQIVQLRWFQGRLAELDGLVQVGEVHEANSLGLRATMQLIGLLAPAAAGRREVVTTEVDALVAREGLERLNRVELGMLAELLTMVGVPGPAAEVGARLEAAGEDMIASSGFVYRLAAASAAGRCAALVGDLDRAVRLFETGSELERSARLLSQRLRTDWALADCLDRRGRSGDRRRAEALRAASVHGAEPIGLSLA